MMFRESAPRFRLTPEVILEVLQGVNKLGVQMVLELQDRSSSIDYFAAGRAKQHLDPRLLSGPALIELVGSDPIPEDHLRPADDEVLQAPEDCSFLHEWICFLDAKTTDAYGWQYKSDMISSSAQQMGIGTVIPEVWSPSPSHRCTARRRVWFRPYCASFACINAKKTLSAEVSVRCRGGESLRGELWRKGIINRTWKKHFFVLTDKSLDYHSGPPSVINKQGSLPLSGGFKVKRLYGKQCPARSFALIIEAPKGDGQSILLDAYSEHERSDWVFHLSYIVALLYPLMNFPPLPTSPPFQVKPEEGVLFRGDLVKQGHILTKWITRHFELTHSMLKYYDGVKVKGSVALLDATLTDLFDGSDAMNKPALHGKRDELLEFSLTSRSGNLLRLRAPTKIVKEEWLEMLGGTISQAGRSFVGIDDHKVKESMARSQVLFDSGKTVIGRCDSIIDSGDKPHANKHLQNSSLSEDREDWRTLGFRLTSSLPAQLLSLLALILSLLWVSGFK